VSALGRILRWPWEYLLILGALVGSNFLPTKEPPPPQPWPDGGQDFAQYLGQATTLLRLSGKHLIFDPMFSRRFSFAGVVKRRTAPPVAVKDLPPIDLVLLSHAHGDHLDLPSLKAIAAANPAPLTIVGAQGVAGYAKDKLEPEHPVRAINLTWKRAVEVAGMEITAWPGRHLGGRHWVTLDFHKYQYCGFVIQAPARTVFFPGDSGLHPAFAELPGRFDIDLALMPIDAFNRRDFLRPRHMAPEDALDIFRQSGARRMIPVHWGTFTLCNEPLGLSQQRLGAALAADPALAARVHNLPLGGVLPL
jgi:L-ascorbate metabolism protein UlaG (beta-lactamase superfamily)